MPSTPSPSRMALAQPEDIPLLAAMRRTEGWPANEWLLRVLTTWPQARLLVLRDAGREVTGPIEYSADVRGTTVATAYGAVGFIGNVIVDRAARARGYGKTLMATAIDWLKAQGAQTVVLDATAVGRPLYERFGFVGTVHSWVVSQLFAELRLDDMLPDTVLAVQALGTEDFGGVSVLDRMAFGGDRKSLLVAIHSLAGSSGYVVRGGSGDMEGYLLVRPLEESSGGLHVGPFVARSHEAARVLFVEAMRRERAMIPNSVGNQARLALGVPGSSTAALELYRTLGLSLVRDDLRMQLDLADGNAARAPATDLHSAGAGRPQWIYSMLSTMVG